MSGVSWPRENELNEIKEIVSAMAGRGPEEVRVVVSPYRICPLGAHIDHQGGTVSAMTINKGILLGFIPSDDTEVILRSGQFKGEVRFSIDEVQQPRPIRKKGEPHATDSPKLQEADNWGNFARGAVYALQSRGISLTQGITGYICGSEGLDSSGLSSSAAAGVAYLLAFETANNLTMTPTENIEYDRLIENEYLGLKNGILDQSAILLSSHGFLTHMNCKTKEHKLVPSPKQSDFHKSYKILLAFSGLRNALTNSPGYNLRVVECHEAARILLKASGNDNLEHLDPEVYETHKGLLEPNLAKRAEHYFSENMRVMKGLEAWASGNLEEFGKLISASGLSSIQNYECGCEPLKQLYEILLKAPGVYGTRFSGAGFRGCCLAFVDANLAEEAVTFVTEEYRKAQPKHASQIFTEKAALICDAGDCARGKDCSRKCESEFCSVPPFLRYGKYCGLLYSGCPGEKPCDGLDACCMKHDACIQSKNNSYLSQECSQNFISCMSNFKTGARTFKGNKCRADEVIHVISVVMEAALLAGRALHKP
ncbi:galacturonokinase [Populus alba x Populus x berolinensis]|uniref:phospholipase A2 n=1 Tax=Populus alba x Populus x berolinensis TaxID=444605 RepID=A0AAD6QLI1_9ROSI|nr:galacturonokinase [Populus alba x Populus x berolinensis]